MDRAGLGIACAIVGAALWGFSGACMQYLFEHSQVTSLFITGVRMLGAGILFLALLAVRKRELIKNMLADRESVAQLCVFGSFGLFLCQVTYVVTIGYTNAGTATVLQGLNIVFVLVATCVLARRLPGLRDLTSVALAFAAIVAVATKGDLGVLNIPIEGLAWGIFNAASVAFYIMYPKRLFAKWGSLPVTGLGMFVGGIAVWIVIGAVSALHVLSGGAMGEVFTVPVLDASCMLVLTIVVVLGTFAAFGLYLHGVSIAGSMAGSLLGAIEPISATIFSALWLGTFFAWADWLGLALMVATIVLVGTRNMSYLKR